MIRRPLNAERASRWVFAVALVVAVPVILYTNRDQWFFLDEWDFLAGRDLRNIGDLLRPHNEHWTTVPIVIYRLLFRAVGLRHYWPYQLPVVAAHLLAATMLRIVMRRAGVGPWLATAAAGLFVFLGSGRSDLAWGFQVTFTGALAFGLTHLVLSDHDGDLDHRDLAGIGFGLAAIMSSGIGVPMVAAVGIAVLLRRGWRTALVHTAPLGAIYVLWYLRYGRNSVDSTGPAISQLTSFTGQVFEATLDGLGQYGAVTLLLAGLLLLGVVALVRATTIERRRHQTPVIALFGAAVILVIVTGWGRAMLFTAFGQVPDRYVHVVAACLLPMIALGASMLVDRWPPALLPVLVVLLAGLPGNLVALTPGGPIRFTLGSPPSFVALAQEAARIRPPRSLQPDPYRYDDVTVGWLTQSLRQGRIPTVPTTPDQRAHARVQLSFAQLARLPHGRCERVPRTGPVTLRTGDVLEIRADTATVTEARSLPATGVTYPTSLLFDTSTADQPRTIDLRAVRPIAVQVQPGTPGGRVRVCR